ncbi:substrate-binding domain-containing protein [Pelagibius sp. CAU 1746]|uniref:LacI family DNA-binding transcriptional regulator n=1 Tax=Pelagibius sp. CAU 1746 TaxID=3140370 RepID=UPI00325C084D
MSKRLQKRSKRNEQPPATLKDVAVRAGVSTATVSRVLNAQGRVNRETEAKVTAAVAALGYVPHAAARALASRRSRTIGAVTAALDNPIFAKGIQALEHRLEQSGYGLLVASSNYEPQRELKQVRTMVERGIDAIMLQGDNHLPEVYLLLQRKGIPYINTWVYDAAAPHPCCGFNNETAGRSIAEYLLDLGHREIAMVGGITTGNDRARGRIKGVRTALQARGLDLRPERLVERPYTISDGRDGLREILAAPGTAPRPTAVIGGNDLLAIGVILEAQQSGLTVPGDLSVAGFDDIELAANIAPALTTVHVPVEDICTLAGDFLVARVEGRPARDHLALEARLVVRQSTARPGGRR